MMRISVCASARAQPIDGNDDSCLSLLAFLILSSHTTSIVHYIIIFSIRHTAHQAFTDEEDAAVHTGVDTLWKVRSMMRAYNMNVSTIVPNHLGYLIFFSINIISFHLLQDSSNIDLYVCVSKWAWRRKKALSLACIHDWVNGGFGFFFLFSTIPCSALCTLSMTARTNGSSILLYTWIDLMHRPFLLLLLVLLLLLLLLVLSCSSTIIFFSVQHHISRDYFSSEWIGSAAITEPVSLSLFLDQLDHT